MRLCSLLTLLSFVFAATSYAATTTEIAGRATVIDADSIDIHGERIRLNGIDAPESRQYCYRSDKPWRCGQKAALALSDHIGAAPVRCVPTGKDHYQRILAVCSQNDININEWLVAQGWALAYRKYSNEYVGAEDQARDAKLGIWSGEFQPPWNWRADQRAKSRPAAEATNNDLDPSACAVNRCQAMTSCAQAKRALVMCEFYFLDGDGDGVPCESLCSRK